MQTNRITKMNKTYRNSANFRYRLSLLLIVVSFVFLIVFSYNALVRQKRMLEEVDIGKKIEQADKICSQFLQELRTQKVPPFAVNLPMEQPIFPDLKVPSGDESFQHLFISAISTESALLQFTKAEINADPSNKGFWQFKICKLHFDAGDYFLARKAAFKILASPFDYILPDGKSLKYHAAILAAKSNLIEQNTDGFQQWLYKLADLPIPRRLPSDPNDFFSMNISKSNQDWLEFLIWCYKKSSSQNLIAGWQQSNGKNYLLLDHKLGIIAFPGDYLIKEIGRKLNGSVFHEKEFKLQLVQSPSNHRLKSFNGLFIAISGEGETARIDSNFVLLLILTSLGIIGLFGFSLYEWQIIQQKKLLEEEELFFRQTTHDLKTPLTTVRFLAETISLGRYKSDEQRQKYLTQLLNETDRAAFLIDQMLLSVRLRKKLIKAEPSVFSPHEKINHLIQRFAPRLSGWNISVEIPEEILISADLEMWERVHINLIENAIKHADAGKCLDISSRQLRNKRLSITIKDKGPGLSGLQQNTETSLLWGDLPYKPKRGGSGIGLYLVRQIMREHNGNFMAKNRSEKGLSLSTDWQVAEDKENDK